MVTLGGRSREKLGVVVSSFGIFLGLAYEVLRSLAVLGGALFVCGLIAAVVLAAVYHLVRGLLRLRSKPRLRADQEAEGSVLEWLR
ncbi:hypothetical protein GCM10009530_11870 [Microbispora corallina]|uniref:Uncharacterized protein n=1 Tax=Microbispora corallina TaxID=83302 RepID=A0ABQ4FTH0_9ACTN|nr:hypothetical protein [Microbispora corallina]GIH38116.1 hypothetical protein Mco01_11160 [Microbispora corallina]